MKKKNAEIKTIIAEHQDTRQRWPNRGSKSTHVLREKFQQINHGDKMDLLSENHSTVKKC